MTDDVKDALERVRQICDGDSHSDVYGRWGLSKDAEACDKQTLADAYLAEHPADEDELITFEWLEQLSMAEPSPWPFSIRLCADHSIRLVCDDVVSTRPSTRGDLRRLCAALGIHLKEDKS